MTDHRCMAVVDYHNRICSPDHPQAHLCGAVLKRGALNRTRRCPHHNVRSPSRGQDIHITGSTDMGRYYDTRGDRR